MASVVRAERLGLAAALLVMGTFLVNPERAGGTERSAPPAFPGTNGKIAFQSNRTGSTQIFTMSSVGKSEAQLVAVNASNYDAAWAPDGTGLGFSSCCAPGTSALEIYEMNANGSGVTRVTDNGSTDSLSAWSPDGLKVAFVSQRDGNKEIYVMNADGTGQANLSNHSATDTSPAWSPDGTKILFMTTRGGDSNIYRVNVDGTGLKRLTKNTASDTEPTWSPDGAKVAFVTSRTGNNEIYTMKSDGSGLKNLTNNSAADDRPAWSPDGAKIAFDSNRAGNYDIWVMNSDGAAPTALTNDPAADQRPDWQPVTGPIFHGIDISHWQGTIDFEAVAADGIRFIFAKATEGQTYDDPNYITNREGAAATGIPLGAYHFARPDKGVDDAVKEADHFMDTALPEAGDLLPVIDLEDSGGLSTTALTDWLWDFLDEVLARKGVHALIYTSPAFWQTYMGDTDAFAEGGYSLLWIAHWFAPTPDVPGKNWGGNGWTFWQNSNCIDVDGIAGCVDSDYFNGVILTPAQVP